MYKLRDWIDETRLTPWLSQNERAEEYLETHEHLIDNYYIMRNEYAMHIIEKKIKKDEFIYNWLLWFTNIFHGFLLFCINILKKITTDDDEAYQNTRNCIKSLECSMDYNKQLLNQYNGVNYNKNAVNFLRNNPQYIDYEIMCCREHGIEFVDELIKNNELEKINWRYLSRNPAAMHILTNPEYYEFIDWVGLLYNKNSLEFVKNNLHMVEKHWDIICAQPHLIKIIEENVDKINWNSLSCNYNAIPLLEKNVDKINWCVLSSNHNAIHILEQNMEKIYVEWLCDNKNGFQLLLQLGHDFDSMTCVYHKNIVFEYFDYCEKNNNEFDLIDQLSRYGYTEKHMEFLKYNSNYNNLSQNPNIFEYDYKRMHETRQSLLWYNDIKNEFLFMYM